ncbi:hypothetical protein GCM10018790_39850 [Kitasatospora xanthocidica]|uniref:DUF4097 family beta strand repeat-containing protein n=1 Tax=Kitasatospora xanthocidica TaxID=83382 RepID=UPI0016720B65|nr:DUF4097 family beta strand repeat-containing protein [Kitasatospora xanthocidica]GHF58072.1 hypothetical protein GCM10018790_39850 [Kitasatospora xanthocidica]
MSAGAAKAWRVTGTVATVLVLIGAGLQTWSVVAQQESTSSRSYEVPVDRLRLETGNASVRVRAGRADHVVVGQRLDWTVRKPVVSSIIVDGLLTVRVQCRPILPVADFGCGAEIEVEVPAQTGVSGSLGSGSVRVEGLSGNVDVELGSGELLLSGTSGDVTARATSGLIRGEDLKARRVDARTTSGAMELSFASAPQQVETRATSGSVTMTLPRGSRYAFSSDIGSGTGRIDPQLADSGSPNHIHATATSGSITIDPS